jgi:hypothetical protein
MYILKDSGVDFCSSLTYKEFAKKINNTYEDYNLENIERVLENMLKNQYAKSKLNVYEQKDIFEFYNFLVDRYEEKNKGLDKFRKCYIDNYIRKV